MNDEELEKLLASIRAGICPECGGKLDPPKLAVLSLGVGKVCRCYECGELFYVQPKEG